MIRDHFDHVQEVFDEIGSHPEAPFTIHSCSEIFELILDEWEL
jgi:hypothetical protein